MREKFDYLQLDLWGSVTVDLKMSKITAEGSFKYLTDTKVLNIDICIYLNLRNFCQIIFQNHNQVDIASLHYMSQTKTKTLNGDLARRVS